MIPKVQPTEDQRKIKILNSEIERLQQLIATGGVSNSSTDNGSVPTPVLLAISFLARYQETTTPKLVGASMFHEDEGEIVVRDILTEEQMAVGAGCDLIRDYFDQHNRRMNSSHKKPKK